MSGISTGTGLFSGVDSRSIIDQLIAIESRPKQLAQARIVTLQQQRAAFLDLNSRINNLKSAAAKFRIDRSFDLKTASSSNENVMTATANATSATGTYAFRVERLVTTQQDISRGFADRATTGLGMSSISFESAKARLDSFVSLSDLNGGSGVARGKIVITDSAARTATVDLSKAVSVDDVLSAINANGTAQVTASVKDGAFVIRDNAGGSVSVTNGAGYTTADSLGLTGQTPVGGVLTGARVYGLNVNTALQSLNDGNGVFIRGNTNSTTFANFTLQVDGTNVNVNLSDVYELASGATVPTKTKSAVSSVGGALTRINEALAAAGFSDVTASVDAANGRLQLNAGGRSVTVSEASGGTTAKDLGLTTGAAGTGTIVGRRVLAGMNSVLASSLNGGAGIAGDGQLSFTLRDGTAFSLTIDRSKSLSDILADIEAASGTTSSGAPRLRATLDRKGTGITLTDQTGGGGNLIVSGTAGNDTAASLTIATAPAGVASSTINSSNLQRQYISSSTLLEKLNNGKGVGTGTFRVRDSAGRTAVIDIGSDSKTLGDVINEINTAVSTSSGGGASEPLSLRARINAKGDGIELYDTGTGSTRLRVEDVSGVVAKGLNIAGTATGTGVGDLNRIDGSLERTVTLNVSDTLDDVARKINDAGLDVTAAVISDGAGATPFRLAFTSKLTGRDGRFVMDTGSTDLGVSTLARGENALAFFGAGDVASAIAVSSSSNTIDSILPGVKIDLKGTSSEVVQLNVAQDGEGLQETIQEFVTTFNTAIDRINTQTRYDKETNRRSALTGDGTANELKSALARIVQQRATNLTGRYQRLSDVGIKVGKDSKLEFDEEKFTQAMTTDPQAVEALFTTRTLTNNQTTQVVPGVTVTNPNFGSSFSALGAMGQIEQLAERYVNTTNGVLTSRSNSLQTQITVQNQRIEQFDVRLESRRLILERQFQAMESTIGRLQSQQSSLSAISARR